MSAADWLKSRAGEFEGQLLFEEPLAKHTYYRIGGPAEVIAVPRSHADLELLARAIRETGAPYFILGMGSNLLAPDSGFQGIAVKTQKLDLGIEIAAPGVLRTGASVAISSLLRRAAQEGWGGLEFLTGIPGSVGGAVRMNAGTHLGESASRLSSVEVFSLSQGVFRTVTGAELKFQYRRCLFLEPTDLVVSALWRVDAGDPAAIKKTIDETLVRRKATQPLDAPSCGSVFKNPKSYGVQAWEVIDRLGLRGHQIGNARISEKHSNWILNLGGALASDVEALIELVKTRARDELGVEMEEEVVRIRS